MGLRMEHELNYLPIEHGDLRQGLLIEMYTLMESWNQLGWVWLVAGIQLGNGPYEP